MRSLVHQERVGQMAREALGVRGAGCGGGEGEERELEEVERVHLEREDETKMQGEWQGQGESRLRQEICCHVKKATVAAEDEQGNPSYFPSWGS